MSKPISDGNIIGRIGALALIVAAGFGLHRLNCAEMCPVVKTDSCCSGAAHSKAASSPVSGLEAK